MKALAPLGRAMARGASPRVLLLFVLGLFLPTLLAMIPIHGFFRDQLGHFPAAKDAVGSLGSFVLIQVAQQAAEPGAARSIGQGLVAAFLVSLVVAPFLAGVAGAQARVEGVVRLRELLRGGGDYYGRMVRMTLVGILPYGAAGIVSGIAIKVASTSMDAAVLESAAARTGRIRDVVIVLTLWLAHVTLEAGRAHLIVEPARTSAFFAWCAGIRSIVRHPGRMMAIAVATGVSSMVLAAVFVSVRQRLPQANGGGVLMAFVLGQLAVAAMGWGRTSGIVGMVEVVRGGGKGLEATGDRLRARRKALTPGPSPPRGEGS
jgi:hypothetical protein